MSKVAKISIRLPKVLLDQVRTALNEPDIYPPVSNHNIEDMSVGTVAYRLFLEVAAQVTADVEPTEGLWWIVVPGPGQESHRGRLQAASLDLETNRWRGWEEPNCDWYEDPDEEHRIDENTGVFVANDGHRRQVMFPSREAATVLLLQVRNPFFNTHMGAYIMSIPKRPAKKRR